MELKEIEELLYNRAYNYIRLRERSEKEISNYLKKKIKKYSLNSTEENNIAISIIKRLQEAEVLNDSKFIDWWVNQRSYFKPRGTYLLKQELQAKGVKNDDIKDYFIENNIDEKELAFKALLAKSKIIKDLSHEEAFKKALSFLMRRGFHYELSKKTFEEWWQKR